MSSRDRSRRPSLIIRNLPLDTRKPEVEDLFSKYGQIRDVYLPVNHYTRRFQGYGFIEFYDMRDAEDAQEALDNKVFGGRNLEVKWSRDDRKTPREMVRRENDRDDRGPRERNSGGRRSGYGGGRRSYSPEPRHDRDRSPGYYPKSPPRRHHSPDRRDSPLDSPRSYGGGGYTKGSPRRSPPPHNRSPALQESRSPPRH